MEHNKWPILKKSSELEDEPKQKEEEYAKEKQVHQVVVVTTPAQPNHPVHRFAEEATRVLHVIILQQN